MQAINMFRTSDGKMFEDQTEAMAHESAITNEVAISAFIAKHYPAPAEGRPGPSAGIARKAIALWLSEQNAATVGDDGADEE